MVSVQGVRLSQSIEQRAISCAKPGRMKIVEAVRLTEPRKEPNRFDRHFRDYATLPRESPYSTSARSCRPARTKTTCSEQFKQVNGCLVLRLHTDTYQTDTKYNTFIVISSVRRKRCNCVSSISLLVKPRRVNSVKREIEEPRRSQ